MADVQEATGMLPARSKLAHDDGRLEPIAPIVRTGQDRFEIIIERDEDGIARRLTGTPLHAATVFQSEPWTRAWYATIGRTVGEPMLLSAIDRRTGNLAVMLPLVRRAYGTLRIVEFADHGVSDSNAPVLGASAPTEAADARWMWQAVRKSLIDADLVRFTKMPPEIESRANPLALLPSARLSSLTGNVLTINGSWESYLATLKGVLRKQLRKSWRIFAEHDGATFRRIEKPEEAARILAILERQQSARLHAQGIPYRLDQPEFSAFYHTVTAEGVADGSIVLTALMHHDEVVAALLGLARGTTYVMVRISTGAEQWSNLSPGRLIIMRTMQLLHAEGCRLFDFSVGDYPYKRRLGARSQPLFDLTDALTSRALPMLAYDRAKQFVRRHPTLHALARRIVKPSDKIVGEAASDDRG